MTAMATEDSKMMKREVEEERVEVEGKKGKGGRTE